MLSSRKVTSKYVGFTLIEMVISVAIIGVLAGTVIEVSVSTYTNGKAKQCEQTIKAIQSAKLEWRKDHPAALEDFFNGGESVIPTNELLEYFSPKIPPKCGGVTDYVNVFSIGETATCPNHP